MKWMQNAEESYAFFSYNFFRSQPPNEIWAAPNGRNGTGIAEQVHSIINEYKCIASFKHILFAYANFITCVSVFFFLP